MNVADKRWKKQPPFWTYCQPYTMPFKTYMLNRTFSLLGLFNRKTQTGCDRKRYGAGQ